MNTLDEAYELLLSLNVAAFDDSDFDTAYHLLASALHIAQAAGNSNGLDSICLTASRQGDIIDRHNPTYHHGTLESRKRGNKNIFASLSKQAESASNIARSKAARKKLMN